MMQSVPSINFFSKAGKAGLLFFILLLPFLSFSQINRSEIKKFSPNLREQQSRQGREGVSNFVIAVSDTFGFRDFIVKNPGINSIYQYPGAGIFLVRTSWKELYEKIIPRQDVVFIDVLRVPKEEVAVSNLDLSTNKVNWVHARFPQFNGQSLTVSVKENLPDTADIDFKG